MKSLSKIKKRIDKSPYLKIAFWVVLLFVGFFANDLYNWMKTKPSIEVIMPEGVNPEGDFTITLINGEVPLKNIEVNIQSCYMENNEWRHYSINELAKGQEYPLKIFEEKTNMTTSLIDCRDNPLAGWENNRRMMIDICKDTLSGRIYIPTQNFSFLICGDCYWNLSIKTSRGNFSFLKKVFLPINQTLMITNATQDLPGLSSGSVACSKDMAITFFGEKELWISGEYD